MSPQQHFDKPGKSPYMDMDLVPRYASDNPLTEEGSGNVKIESRIQQNIGLRKAVVERIAVVSSFEATGLLEFNQREVSLEQMRSNGLVERVWPLAPGDVIEAGQPLAELLIPQWTAAQAEYLVLRGSTDSETTKAAFERLRLLGIPREMLAELAHSGRAQQSFILRSSRAGLLESLDVRAGMALTVGQTLARIQGLESVWLEVAVPESRAAAVQLGGLAEIQLSAFPGLTLNGQITTVLPSLATGSRTLQVRVELPNPQRELRAGMSAQVRLGANSGDFALAVPTEAIIQTGKRALVIALQEDGSFVPVEVTLGQEIDNRTIIAAGLSEGETVVASAQFLLDSEATLSGLFPRPAGAAGPHSNDQQESGEIGGATP
jgi:Cu(I)/Ag(I) efflux system membrane fusion protein